MLQGKMLGSVSRYSFSLPGLPRLFHLLPTFIDKASLWARGEKGIFRSISRTFCRTALEFQSQSMALDPDNHRFSMINHIN